MSKYDELSKAYGQARRTFRAYEETCRDFARDLVFGMVEYFEWPRGQEITYIPLGEELDPDNRFYALAGAMRMDDESFWHFGVQLTLHEGSGSYPLPFVLSFFVKKTGDFFVVKLGPRGREIRIPESKKGELDPFYEAVYMQIKEFFARRYIQAVTKQEKEFGFITLLDFDES